MRITNKQHKNALWRHAAVSLAAAALAPALAATMEADDVGQIVTATRTASRIDAVVADVTVIGREQIAASAGQSLSQVLARQVGIQLSSNGGLGKSSSLYVRGGQQRHTLVLVDGVRFGSATSGSPSLDNFPLEAIDHIEVVRGPMASLYGSDAVAGVIQIFTRRGHVGSQFEASVTGGSEEFHQATAAWSGGIERWQGAVTVSEQATQGFSATNRRLSSSTQHHPDRDGFRQQSLQGSLSHDIATGWRMRWQGVVAQGDNETDDGQLAKNPGLNRRADVRSSVQSLAVTGRLMPSWRSEWRVARSYDSSNVYVARSAADLGRFATTQRQVSWDNTLEVPLGTALVALDHVEQNVQSTAKYPVRNRTMDALVLGWSGELGPHAWQLSARHDHNSQYGDQPTAAVAYGCEFSPGWRVGASVGSTFSAPTFNDLYYPGRGDPSLKPQEGVSKELSLTRVLEHGRWRVAYHRNDVRGYIQSTATQVIVTPAARLEGVTLSADQDWDTAWGQWALHGSADWLNAIDQDTGKYLRRRANGVFQGDITHTLGRWQQSLGATVRDGMFNDDANKAAERLGGVGLWHASVRYQVDRDWALAFRVDNLTDRTYQTAWGYNQARRQWFLTLSYSQAKPKP